MKHRLVRKMALDLIDSDIYRFENEEIEAEGNNGESFDQVAADLDKRVAERTAYHKRFAETKKGGQNALPGIAPIFPTQVNPPPNFFPNTAATPVFNNPSVTSAPRTRAAKTTGGCPPELEP